MARTSWCGPSLLQALAARDGAPQKIPDSAVN
jgi:hypothetical protein